MPPGGNKNTNVPRFRTWESLLPAGNSLHATSLTAPKAFNRSPAGNLRRP